MSESAQQLTLLLHRVADEAGPFEPPPVSELVRQGSRRPRGRGVVAVAASVAAVVAVAAGVAWIGRPSPAHEIHRRTGGLALPAPAGPAVSVAQLRTYGWSALPEAPIEQRGYAASAWTGRVMIVWGGRSPGESLYADGATYDPATRTWSTLPPSPLSPRADAVSVVAGGAFYVWGGRTDPSGNQAVDGARFDLRTGTWTKLAAAPVRSYRWAQLVVAGGRAVLLSSATDDAFTIHAAAYDASRDRWHPLPDLSSPPGRDFFDATALGVGPTVLLWRSWSHQATLSSSAEGVEIGTSSGVDAVALDVRSGSWTSTSLGPDQGRSAGGALWTGRQVVLPDEAIYCGACSHPMVNEVAGVAIEPSTGARTTLPGNPANAGHAAFLWTGGAVLSINLSTTVGSGKRPSLQPGDLAAWDPATNAWTRLPGFPAPTGLDGAAMVWAGTQLLVWGVDAMPSGGAAFRGGSGTL